MADDTVTVLRPGAPGDGPFCASSLALRSPPARAWHFVDWIPERTVTLLTGDGGTGKSTLALQLSVATATGTPWLGRTPRQGPVLFVSAEDDRDELHRRLVEICTGASVDLGDLSDLHLWPLADQDAVMATEGRAGSLVPTDRWSELLNHAMYVQPALVVLDSLADIFGGNENDRAEVRQFVALLRRLAMATGAAVVVLSHPSLAGMSTGSGSSGSTAWSNSVRSRIYFSRPAGDGLDGDPDLRLLSLKKSNYGAAQPDLRLKRRGGGFFLEDGQGTTSLDMAVARRRVDQLFLDLMAAYTAQGRTVSDKAGANYAPSLFARDTLAKGTTKAGFDAAMNRLFAAGEIRIETVGPPTRQRRNLVRVTAAVAE